MAALSRPLPPPAKLSKSKTHNHAIVKGVTQPETRQRLAGIGAEVVASSPEEFGRFIRSELQKWARIIKESGASAH